MSPSGMLLRYHRVHEAAHLVRRVLNEPRHFRARRLAARELLAGPPAAVRLVAPGASMRDAASGAVCAAVIAWTAR